MTTISIKFKKDLDTVTEKKILRLKGSIISEGFTDIIHIDDDGDDFYVNHFATESSGCENVVNYIEGYIRKETLEGIITIVKKR